MGLDVESTAFTFVAPSSDSLFAHEGRSMSRKPVRVSPQYAVENVKKCVLNQMDVNGLV